MKAYSIRYLNDARQRDAHCTVERAITFLHALDTGTSDE
jgi:hypothetical protein